MVDAYAQSQAAMREAEAVQAQMQAQAAQQAAAVGPEMPNETVLGDGSGLPF